MYVRIIKGTTTGGWPNIGIVVAVAITQTNAGRAIGSGTGGPRFGLLLNDFLGSKHIQVCHVRGVSYISEYILGMYVRIIEGTTTDG